MQLLMTLGEVYIMGSDLGSNDQLWNAFEEEEFELALTLIDKTRHSWSKRDWSNNGARGTALMGLQRFNEAVKELAFANELAAQGKPAFSYLAFGEKEGAALWLSGARDLAAAKWKEIVEAMISGKKTMGDLAGGVSPCMLLWFSGQTLHDATLSELAKKHLKKLSKGSKIRYWPGPLAAIALEQNRQSLFSTIIVKRHRQSTALTNKLRVISIVGDFLNCFFTGGLNAESKAILKALTRGWWQVTSKRYGKSPSGFWRVRLWNPYEIFDKRILELQCHSTLELRRYSIQ